MPSPDQPDDFDFSHLPTTDEGPEGLRQRNEALWSAHRPAEAGEDGSQEPEVAPDSEPTLPTAPEPVAHSADWQALFESEPEDLYLAHEPDEESVPVPEEAPAPPPRIRVNKTVVRPAPRVEPAEHGTVEPVQAGVEQVSAPASVSWPEEAPVTHEVVATAAAESFSQETVHTQAAVRLTEEKPTAASRIRSNPRGKTKTKIEPPADQAETTQAGEGIPADQTIPQEIHERPVGITTAPAAVQVQTPAEEQAQPKASWLKGWEKVGGLALILSIAVHLLLIGGATYWVVSQSAQPSVDFLSGGGTMKGKAASAALEHQIQQKKTPWLQKALPKTRLAVDTLSDVSLPEMPPDLMDIPKASGLTAPTMLSAGFGTTGAGGGMGNGVGMGNASGVVFKPFSLFGKDIKATRLAVILDVSTSMAVHLPRVIAEVDKVARGSVVILYFGCGLETPPGGRSLNGDDVYRASGPEFERYWRLEGEDRRKNVDMRAPIPMEAVFQLLSRRPQTFFVHNLGVGYAWTAMLCNEVRSADALYWFADFQDQVDFDQLTIVQENLKNRKQRLYMHAYERGSSFDLIRSQLVEPTGGDVIEEVQ